jgi:hypothetical protein
MRILGVRDPLWESSYLLGFEVGKAVARKKLRARDIKKGTLWRPGLSWTRGYLEGLRDPR